jgi:hypothetical protein
MIIASKLSNIGVPITTMADADTIGWIPVKINNLRKAWE